MMKLWKSAGAQIQGHYKNGRESVWICPVVDDRDYILAKKIYGNLSHGEEKLTHGVP